MEIVDRGWRISTFTNKVFAWGSIDLLIDNTADCDLNIMANITVHSQFSQRG